jgi:hypothetical protein
VNFILRVIDNLRINSEEEGKTDEPAEIIKVTRSMK